MSYELGRGAISHKDLLIHHLQKPRGDEEGDHSRAEKLLCTYLRSVGEFEIADAWEKAKHEQNWWYA